jgi:cellulose synthase/poly-beta-1,6-N-acetylglucosamine synthase-like glycosyltransferase
MSVVRVLIGSPIRQKPAILAEFLRSIDELDPQGLELAYHFVDDNTAEESSALLTAFAASHPDCILRRAESQDTFVCDEQTHHWTDDLWLKVGSFKDRIVADALQRGFDFVFLVDSDVVMAPRLLRHLVSLDKPVVSEVFWTSFQPAAPMLPQVWVADQYTLFERGRSEKLADHEEMQRAMVFMKQLRRPGVYPVGGLGACTLIARRALERGASFAPIDNLSFWGEDRHFCVRARALGIELWADTRMPPLHLYRESDLERVAHYRARFAADFLEHPKLTLSMCVHNEADRWLRQALRAHRPFIHEAVIIDDASTDDTSDVVRRELDGIPLRLVRNETSRFSNEVELRKQQWAEALKTNPDWLLFLDADDLLESRAKRVIPELLAQTNATVFGFHMYDFWDEAHYREDTWWKAHSIPRPFLLRYTPDYLYRWTETPQHCGRMPSNLSWFNSAAIDLRVKHMGWSDPHERQRKYERYAKLDPGARYGIREQYESILDPQPTLVPWQELA